MRKIILRVSLLLLLTTLLLGGSSWFYADQLLDSVIRPQIEKIAERKLAARVGIKQLTRTETGLAITDLRIDIPRQLQLAVPRIEIDFSFAGLWNRQFERLRLVEPLVEISAAQESAKSPDSPLVLPDQLPLTINRLEVAQGRLRLNTTDRQWQVHELDFIGALQPQSRFTLSMFLGPDLNHPVTLAGTASWAAQKTLNLEKISWQERQLLATHLVINLGKNKGPLTRGRFQLEHFDHRQLQEIFNALGQPLPLPAELGFSLEGTTIAIRSEQRTLTTEIQVDEGRVAWQGQGAPFSHLELKVNREQESWQVSGRIQGPAQSILDFTLAQGGKNPLSGRVSAEIPDPNQLKMAILKGPSLPVKGGLQVAAEFFFEEQLFQSTFRVKGRSSKNPAAEYLLNISHLSGEGQLLLAKDHEEFTFNLQQASGPLLTAAGDFNQLKFSLTPKNLKTVKQLLAPNLLPEHLPSISGLKISGQLTRKAADWTGPLRLTASEVELSGWSLQQIKGATELGFSSNQVEIRDASVEMNLTHGEELSAQCAARGAGTLSAQGFSIDLRQFSLSQLNYMATDGQTGLGEADLELRGTIQRPMQREPLSLNLKGNLAAREILRGTFYADLSAYRGEFFLNGDFTPETGVLNAKTLQVDLPQIGKLKGSGRFSPEQISLQGDLAFADLAESFGDRLKPLLSGALPATAGLSLEGGLAINGSLNWSAAEWQARGALRMENLYAVWPEKRFEILGGTGVIPFAFRTENSGDSDQTDAEIPGKLAFASLAFGPATLETGNLELQAATNRFSILSPLHLQLAGGQMNIENLSLAWPSGLLRGSVKLNIAGVNLKTLTKEFDLPIMQGRLGANLGTVNYTDRQLWTDGLVNIEVFDGRFQLSNLRFNDPFSGYSTFFADIDFSGLDLRKATRTFDFGEMNGILDGHIHRLQLFGSTPAAFEATLETRTEGKRNISVKALNNLSILSQGGLSAALSRGLYRFIDFYRYKKIGIQCSLENDTFKLQGTALPGSERYLVYGGLLPPRIDITTSTPTISFKEMVKRLGRIDRAGN